MWPRGTHLVPDFKKFYNYWWIKKKKKSVSEALKVNTALFFSVGWLFELKQMELFNLLKWEVGKGYFQKSVNTI